MKMDKNGNAINGTPPVTAKEIESIIAKAGPTQTIRIEQATFKIVPVTEDETKNLHYRIMQK